MHHIIYIIKQTHPVPHPANSNISNTSKHVIVPVSNLYCFHHTVISISNLNCTRITYSKIFRFHFKYACNAISCITLFPRFSIMNLRYIGYVPALNSIVKHKMINVLSSFWVATHWLFLIESTSREKIHWRDIRYLHVTWLLRTTRNGWKALFLTNKKSILSSVKF